MLDRTINIMKNSGLILIYYYLTMETAIAFSELLELCQAQCIDRNLVVPLARGSVDWDISLLAMNMTQLSNACYIGCRDLESSSSCEERCSSVTPASSCIQGCRAVTDIFLHHIQGLLNHVRVSIESESIIGINLVWSVDSAYSSLISDLSASGVQWAVQSRPANTFTPWNITLFDEDKAFKIETLKAMTTLPLIFASKIELRLGIFWRSYIVVSPVYQLPLNDTGVAVPLPPTVVSQLQVSENSFAVCWKSALQRLYRVTLYSVDEKEMSTAMVESSCYLFQNMSRDNCCRIKIDYANSDINSASISLRINLINREKQLESRVQLVFTNGTSLMRLYDIDDYAVFNKPEIIPFEIALGRSITAICSVSAERMVVALDDGSIYWLAIGDEVASGLLRQPDGIAIVHMDVDHMQGSVYAVLHKKGILRCRLSDCQNWTILTTNTVNYIEYISIDSWNGHIYCIMNDGEVFSMPLFPVHAPHNLSFSSIERIPILANAIETEPEKSRILLLLQNGSILEFNIIDHSVTEVRPNVQISDLYHNIKKAHFFGKRMFWISTSCGDAHSWDTCLYSEKYDTEYSELDRNRYFNTGRVVDFVLSYNRPKPLTISPPSRVGLMTTTDTARVTWDVPALLPFQAQGAWRDLHYECRITGDEGNDSVTTEFTQLNETSLVIPISPGLLYHASVRACIDTICSSYATAINSAFASFMDNLFVTFNRTNNRTTYFGMLGNMLSNYTLPGPIPKHEALPFAYDFTVKSLYVVNSNENAIMRISEDGSSRHFLDTLMVKYVTVMSRYALLIIASHYLIVTYRLTSSFDHEIFSCESFAKCGEVSGLASDDETGDVFYLIRYWNGTTSLYAVNQDVRIPYFISSSQNFPALRQLVVIKEKLVFVTEAGEMGACDKKLGSLNINLALNNVALLPLPITESMRPINFTCELATDDVTFRKTLIWSLEPMFNKGTILFKITIYKNQWGGERFVDYSLSQNYTISESLLRQWPSRQKYDAEVEAITAWDVVSTNSSGLVAPTKPPSPPRNLTIYATQQKTVDGPRALMDLFWDEPLEWNGEALSYVIKCTVDGVDEPAAELPTSTRFYFFSVKSGSVSCAVAARNEPTLETFSEPVTIDSSELRPLVRLFAIDSNNNVRSVPNWLPTSSTQIAARTKRQTSSSPTITEQSIAYIGHELYSIRKDFDSAQPFLLLLDSNNVENILHKILIGGEIRKVDAVTSDWVANRLLFVSSARVLQLSLDAIQSFSVITPRRIMNLSSGAGEAKQLLFDPFSNTAFLLTKNGSLFALDLNLGTEENMALRHASFSLHIESY